MITDKQISVKPANAPLFFLRRLHVEDQKEADGWFIFDFGFRILGFGFNDAINCKLQRLKIAILFYVPSIHRFQTG
jgi:hypothetical protein